MKVGLNERYEAVAAFIREKKDWDSELHK
jgi:hypothetical protein